MPHAACTAEPDRSVKWCLAASSILAGVLSRVRPHLCSSIAHSLDTRACSLIRTRCSASFCPSTQSRINRPRQPNGKHQHDQPGALSAPQLETDPSGRQQVRGAIFRTRRSWLAGRGGRKEGGARRTAARKGRESAESNWQARTADCLRRSSPGRTVATHANGDYSVSDHRLRAACEQGSLTRLVAGTCGQKSGCGREPSGMDVAPSLFPCASALSGFLRRCGGWVRVHIQPSPLSAPLFDTPFFLPFFPERAADKC